MTTNSRTAPVTVVRTRGRSTAGRIGRTVFNIVGVVLALIWAFPVYWMINSAFLPNVVLERQTPTWVKFGGSLKNFQAVFADGSFFRSLGISLSIAAIVVTVCLHFASSPRSQSAASSSRAAAASFSRCCSFRCCLPRACSSRSTSS